jgi:hypothetical protein
MVFVRAYQFCILLCVVSFMQLHSMNRHNFGLNCAVNFQCINQSHDDVEIECALQSQFRSYASCGALNYSRILVTAMPSIITGVTACDALYRKASFGAKKLIKIGACTMLYTAASLYFFENYVNNNDMTLPLAGYCIAVGNVAIAELLKR